MSTTTETSKTTLKTFPPVVLDTTLYQLLLDDLPAGEALETYCTVKPNSDPQHGEAVPLSNKYIIHAAQLDDSDDLAHLQLEICSYLLMFFCGPMKVIFLGAEGASKDPTLSQKVVDENAKRSFAVIAPEQRPVIYTYANQDDCAANHDGSKIRWAFAMDFAERLPYLFHPELVYKMNSKRWLAESDLKSANDRIIDCNIICPQNEEGLKHWYHCGATCESCKDGIRKETERIRAVLQERQIPFVLKLTQSLSSVGTNIVTNEEERSAVIDKITDYLQEYLPRITRTNGHLYTTALILSDAIPGKTMALNFYVRRNGTAHFLGACHQLATGESGRQATAITYADQEGLEKKYRSTLARNAKALHDLGYWGPVGADIMEDPSDGTLFTIDLNVRTPLSLVLHLLKGHFNDTRGLGVALVYECVILRISRDELEDRFFKEFDEGRLVLLGGTQLGDDGKWAFGVVIAGKNKDEIDALSDRILRYETDDQVDD